ncbi:2Fe-2S iron-sulfur cluster-binding protein [Vogesella indigofera]|uniref:2Fe-2S iron-sulfur cluster-binding protein n=1 Tax=Vogesella indigofera TaxID=45465 RepID=UPI003F42D563
MQHSNPGNGSPWHRGERTIHEQMGTTAQMEAFGRRVIRDYMPDQHRTFYAQLPFIVAGGIDTQGRPWAGLLEGEPGFIQSPDPRQLLIQARAAAGDPLLDCLQDGAAIGLLGIELHTRRRNRMNGQIHTLHHGGFAVQVGHAFGNCPQYIQDRAFTFAHPLGQSYGGTVERLTVLDDSARAAIMEADTFFVASCFPGDADNPEPQVDVSHRGGKPGFVRIDGDTLTIPDFAGNLHFNTLGNLLVYPKAGLVFIDFASGDMLQLSGSTEIQFSGDDIAAFQGAERLWRFRVEQVVRRRGVLALRWQLNGFSPNSLMTGSWQQAAERLAAAALQNSWRPFRVERIVEESSAVRSFYLSPADDISIGVAVFQAGQHLPIRLSLPGQDKPVIRTYTLSVAPSDGFYRISVKRGGKVSGYLHDALRVGDQIEARAPQGDFLVDAAERQPLVLLAGGIGITPMLAMLRHVVYEGLRTRRVRPSYLFYATRTVAERAFDAEIDELLRRAGGAVQVVRLASQPEADRVHGRDYEVAGHLDLALLKSALTLDDYDFYLCGPAPFMQSLYDGLRELRIADDRIHAEAFGPAALLRRPDQSAATPMLAAVADHDVKVVFAESGKEARWQAGGGNLLELAEARGLTPEFSCRGGSCGTCKVALLEGEVTYQQTPAFPLAQGEVLPCCALPAHSDAPAARIVLKL